MLIAVRKFVRQCPLAVIGIFTLVGTGVTAALVLDTNPPELAREHRAAREQRLAQAMRPSPTPLEPSFDELNLVGP